jgi:hypothetical protein
LIDHVNHTAPCGEPCRDRFVIAVVAELIEQYTLKVSKKCPCMGDLLAQTGHDLNLADKCQSDRDVEEICNYILGFHSYIQGQFIQTGTRYVFSHESMIMADDLRNGCSMIKA